MSRQNTSVYSGVGAAAVAAWLLSATVQAAGGAYAIDNMIDDAQANTDQATSVETTSHESAPEDFGRIFPGEQMTVPHQKAQRLFDAYYRNQRYQEAHKVLTKSLIWRGDKHAQYMLGIMYWHGQGVALDKVKGAAWFRLSAQRGNAKLMKLRDEAWMQLMPEQKTQAAAHFEEIRDEVGDRAVIKALLRRDGWNFNRSIARHPTARGGNLDIFGGSRIVIDGIEYANAQEARVQIRLDYLGGYVEYGELEMIDDATTAANQENTE